MANESMNVYKLIILYMLSKVNTPLPLGFVSDYVIDHGYTNYFNVQNAFGELLNAELIQEEKTYHLSYYSPTNAGQETLSLFGQELSADIRAEIDTYLKENKYDILNKTSLVSDYHRTSAGSYLASCTLREGTHVIFHIDVDVAKEADAIKVCENWQNESEMLYQTAVKKLLH